MKETLIIDETEATDLTNQRHKVMQPHLSRAVNLSNVETLYGLTERAVAVESLIFLGQQYESFKHYLESLLGNCPERTYLHQFYVQTIVSAADLRKPVYMTVASRAIDAAGILNSMNRVNWEVRDVMSQHSHYVDTLLQVFHRRKIF